jgi:hypothetical protein
VDAALARTLAERGKQDAMFVTQPTPEVKIQKPVATTNEQRRKAAIDAILNCTF